MRIAHQAMIAAAAFAVSAPALAQARTQTGSFGDLAWEATSRIVGVTSTATAIAGGDPRYFATAPKYSGTVALLMD